MNYWLVKSEPTVYAWEQFLKDKKTCWDGVRNYTARNHMRSMKKNDWVFFYHSNEGKSVVGVAKVVKEAYPDPSADDATWSSVDLSPVQSFNRHVTLAQIKSDPVLKNMWLVRQGRLSVMPVTQEEQERLMQLAG